MMLEKRIAFLEKMNEALLKALTKKSAENDNPLLQMLIEQQKQILKLSGQIGILAERDSLRERQYKYLFHKINS